MDILYHAIIGLVISKAATHAYRFDSMIFAMLPDLVGATPLQIVKLVRADATNPRNFLKDFIADSKRNDFFGRLDKICYRTTHSLLALVIVGIVTFLFTHNGALLTFSYFSHLLIDIFTHEGPFALRPLYPFSDWHVEGFRWTTNKKVFVGFWIGLIVVFGITFFIH
jgi:membrane-bound metal-dependent hydrolase YbcI (DUF457 family)